MEIPKYLYFIYLALIVTLFQYLNILHTFDNSSKWVLTESITSCFLFITLAGVFTIIDKIYNYYFGVEYE
jgi:hypothetical protein